MLTLLLVILLASGQLRSMTNLLQINTLLFYVVFASRGNKQLVYISGD